MRHLSFACAIASLLALSGCSYDPVAACVSRCESAKAGGCLSSSADCDNYCVLADDTYEAGLDQAEAAGCVAEYQNLVDCYNATPACASDQVIAEMCAEEYLILGGCLD